MYRRIAVNCQPAATTIGMKLLSLGTMANGGGRDQPEQFLRAFPIVKPIEDAERGHNSTQPQRI